jgi:hypothetical protein
MSGFGVPEDGSASLVLALAVVFVSSTPLWALVLWMAKSSMFSQWVAAKGWLKWLGLAYGLAAVAFELVGTAWAYRDLLGPGRRTEQRIVHAVWVAQALLCGLAIIWIQKKRVAASVGPSRTARGKLPSAPLVIVLLVWVVVAGALASVRIGQLATTPFSARDWIALVSASGVIVTLIVLLILNIRRTRRLNEGGGSTGSR